MKPVYHRVLTALLLLPTVSGCGAPDPAEDNESQGQQLIVNGVDVSLKVSSDWGAGYCAQVVLQNASATKVPGWKTVIAMNGSTLSGIWSAKGSVSAGMLTATPESYNQTIAAGASASFGFCATSTSASQRPSIRSAVVGSPPTATATTTSTATTTTTSTATATTTSTATATTTSTATATTTPTATATTTSTATSTSTSGNTGTATSCAARPATGHYQMESLDRGLVAVRSGSGNYVGWRMLGNEYDAQKPSRVAYRVYRNGTLVATVTGSTNYLDSGAPANATYAVSVVVDGTECSKSPSVATEALNYKSIPLTPPPAGTTPSGEAYAYNTGTVTRSSGAVNDGSPGDVDGDGQYELIVIWEPSNAHDNSSSGYTGPVYMDAYKLNGKRLWRLNLGKNIRAGAHYTQFVVYDFDGNGKAEVAVKTAPGTMDSTGAFLSRGPAATDNDTIDYRNADGRILSGPEYLTVFEGATGKELATANFGVPRGTVSSWGDSYGNRVDRFLASAGFVSDQGGSGKGSGRPAILMARGYYTRATVTAWRFENGTLSQLWTADSNKAGSGSLAGKGAHSMAVADVDGDKAQEIIYGAAMIQSDGTFGCATAYGHGDALHVADLIPTRPGLEVFMPHEDKTQQSWDLRDANTCSILRSSGITGIDNGRAVADNVLASNAGAEFWSAADATLRSATSGASLGTNANMTNFLVYWDGDDLRELLDGTIINKGDGSRVFTGSGITSNNYTKATPTLTADLFGDWREEVVWRTPTSNELRVYTTTSVTARRLFTLMHDAQYRMQITSEMTGYNQPPHPSFFLGDGMPLPPNPDLHTK